jgi:hypothetical protein
MDIWMLAQAEFKQKLSLNNICIKELQLERDRLFEHIHKSRMISISSKNLEECQSAKYDYQNYILEYVKLKNKINQLFEQNRKISIILRRTNQGEDPVLVCLEMK